jgi:hypothetical protein
MPVLIFKFVASIVVVMLLVGYGPYDPVYKLTIQGKTVPVVYCQGNSLDETGLKELANIITEL